MKKFVKMTAAILAMFVLSLSVAQASELDDATILAIFDQANMADIASGRLGLKKAESEEVRGLAKMVVTDHTAVQQMGRNLSVKLGLLPVPPANDQSWAALADALGKLEKLDGAAFDQAYLKYEVGYHTAVIDAINSVLLPSIKAPELKALINKVLPGFQHHLAATKKVADKMGVSY